MQGDLKESKTRKAKAMTTYQAQHIAALEQSLNTALFHQACLDSDVSESIRKEHASHVARKRRALNKAIKESM